MVPMCLVMSITRWASSFSSLAYVVEHGLSLFYEGAACFFSSGRWFDAAALCATGVFVYRGNMLLGIFPNLPRMFWRCYHVMRIFVARAERATKRERLRCKKLKSEVVRQRKLLDAADEKIAAMEAALEDGKRHTREMERALLIAAESEAVRMDLGTLESYAAKGHTDHPGEGKDFRIT